MPRVLYERDGRIARITLNRPEVMNAISALNDWTADKSINRAE
jgi:enoyl-CoA hydratase